MLYIEDTYIVWFYICFIQHVEIVSIFARLDEIILIAFKETYEANIKAYNIDVLLISCILKIKIF